MILGGGSHTLCKGARDEVRNKKKPESRLLVLDESEIITLFLAGRSYWSKSVTSLVTNVGTV